MTCNTCRHWRKHHHFDENAYCIVWATLTIAEDACHHWSEREAAKLPERKDDANDDPTSQDD